MILKVLTGVIGVFFLLAVVVQYNDPDPWRWLALYGAATLACALFLGDRLPRWLPAGVGLVAAAWAAILLPDVAGRVGPGELFREIGMDSPEIEVGREAVGLLLVAFWMAVLLVRTRAARER